MPHKLDDDSTFGCKLLRLFQRLMLDGRRHYQTDLVGYLNCSKQTVIRLVAEIESDLPRYFRAGENLR
jgi:hypothetical protein